MRQVAEDHLPSAVGVAIAPVPAGTGRPGLPRLVGVLLGCASVVITLAGIRAARDLVGTVFLALVLVVTAAPISRRLRKHRVPGWLATACVLLTVLGIVFGLFAVLVYSVARLATLIPTYSDQAQGYLDALSGRLRGLGA